MLDAAVLEASAGTRQGVAWPRKVDLFGVGVSVTTYDEAVDVILRAARVVARSGDRATTGSGDRATTGGIVSCHAVHAIVTAAGDPTLRDMVNTFDMVSPDGQPVRWALNLLHRTRLSDRVYGPELMLRLCQGAAAAGVSVYLYGGSPDVIGLLRAHLLRMFPNLRIAGFESPPFRACTPEEDSAAVDRINGSGAGLVFVGLGCPKQDVFAYEHRQTIRAIQVCVGAAFDFHAGVKKMAPRWLQRCGLEWLYRLCQEPGRLGRRYLVTNSIFLAKLAAAWLRGPGTPLWHGLETVPQRVTVPQRAGDGQAVADAGENKANTPSP